MTLRRVLCFEAVKLEELEWTEWSTKREENEREVREKTLGKDETIYT